MVRALRDFTVWWAAACRDPRESRLEEAERGSARRLPSRAVQNHSGLKRADLELGAPGRAGRGRLAERLPWRWGTVSGGKRFQGH